MLNRVIGIMVVLAIGVLAYPFILNPHDNFLRQTEAVIKSPPFPSEETQSDTIKALGQHEDLIADKLRTTKLAVLRQKNHTTKIATGETRENKHSKPVLKNAAWVVHLGTYKDKVKALSLANQLRAKGYNAFIHQSNAAFGEAVQVYIGPEVKKDSAALLAAKLTKETNLFGVVKSYKLLSA